VSGPRVITEGRASEWNLLPSGRHALEQLTSLAGVSVLGFSECWMLHAGCWNGACACASGIDRRTGKSAVVWLYSRILHPAPPVAGANFTSANRLHSSMA